MKNGVISIYSFLSAQTKYFDDTKKNQTKKANNEVLYDFD